MKVLALLLLCAVPVHADEPTPFRWPSHEAIPQRISDVGVGAALGWDAWQSLHGTDAETRWRFACRTGLAFGIVEVLKRVIRRERPNGTDRLSMPSGHTAMAVSSARGHGGASLALTVAWGRMSAGKHYGSDVSVGAGIGLLARKVC